MNVNPGDLNKRIVIIQDVAEQDSDGYVTPKVVEIRRCWASFSRRSGTEVFNAKADWAKVDARFLVRWSPVEITRKMAVLYNGSRYAIEYVNDYGDSKDYIEIWATLKTLEATI